ncbi:hypothetical protein [Nostoc sp. UHCC 0252]|nr:hypothetical protein [Nostoc sp. UHCC 0252]MEA5602224.1 hypothetical protein [Nostoc sp. UHCC 0252]
MMTQAYKKSGVIQCELFNIRIASGNLWIFFLDTGVIDGGKSASTY